jgi:hypothetical protein
MTKQVETMNTFVKNFLSEYGSEELVEEWEAKTNQEQFMSLCNSLKTTKSTKTKDLNKPKRGKSAYLFFCAAKRSEVKEELEAAADEQGADKPKATDVTKELGRQWNLLKESKKQSDKKLLKKCEEEAAADKERYETEKKKQQQTKSATKQRWRTMSLLQKMNWKRRRRRRVVQTKTQISPREVSLLTYSSVLQSVRK